MTPKFDHAINEVFNLFKKKTAVPANRETPAQKLPEKGLLSALETLILKSNVEVSKERVYEGDKHDSDMYSVNGKKVLDVMLGNPPFIQIIDRQGKTEKIDPKSGKNGLDKIVSALVNAGANIDDYSEGLAYDRI